MTLLKQDISKHLADLFVFSFSSGSFPSILKTTKAMVVFKKGSKLDCYNYRRISFIKCWKTTWKTYVFFFSIWVFFHEHLRITGLQVKGEDISLTPHYPFHPRHRDLDISRAIIAESSPLRIASSRTGTGNLWCPRASR